MAAPPCRATVRGVVLLTIFHTNDFHNRLNGAQAERLRLLRSSDENSLLLDAGDASGSGNITFRPGGEPIFDLMNTAGYDAMTVGNRDFHFSYLGFHTKLSRARFPVLCANVRTKRGETGNLVEYYRNISADSLRNREESGREQTAKRGQFDPPVVPFVVRSRPAFGRIVIFGLTVPMITERMVERRVSSYLFDDPAAVAGTLVPRLREIFQPELLVALTHIGVSRDRLLANAVSGIDLIVGGHSHTTLPEGEKVGETLLVQTGSHGKNVGRVVVERTAAGLTMTASLETL